MSEKKKKIEDLKKTLEKVCMGVVSNIESVVLQEGSTKKDSLVGLDIGVNSIKLVQFLRKEDGLHLKRVDLQEIKYTSDENLREKEALELLKKMVRGVDIKRSRFIATVNCPRTQVRRIIAPYMPKGELHHGIRLAAKNYFPFPIDDAILDFEILGEVIEKSVKKYQVLVATSPRKTIEKYLSLLGAAGIKPSSLVPVSYALQKLVQELYFKKREIQCFLDIGTSHTELVIFKGRNMIFSRKIPVAGGDFTKEMTGLLVSDKGRTELSMEDAERIKRYVGIPGQGESKMIENKISTVQILSMIRTSLEQLVNEIDRCFDYYREETDGGKIDTLVLLGGGASLSGLSGYLSDELGIEIKVANPLENLKIESGKIDAEDAVSVDRAHWLAMAVGAALSGGRGINLLPPEIKDQTKRTFKRASVQAIGTGVVLTLVLIYMGMKIQLGNYQKRIAAGKMELSSLGPQLKQVEKKNLIDEILMNEPYWEDVFKDISNIIPDGIYLTELSMDRKIIKMQGIIVSDNRQESLSDFMLSLENGIFKNVKLIVSKEIKDQAANEFELSCWVD